MTKSPTVFLLMGIAACHPTPEVTPDADTATRSTVLTAPAYANPDLDLLFVIDDSPSMADKQQALLQAFPSFVAQLATAPGGSPNLHLGVVTSDMGTKGKNDPIPGPGI